MSIFPEYPVDAVAAAPIHNATSTGIVSAARDMSGERIESCLEIMENNPSIVFSSDERVRETASTLILLASRDAERRRARSPRQAAGTTRRRCLPRQALR